MSKIDTQIHQLRNTRELLALSQARITSWELSIRGVPEHEVTEVENIGENIGEQIEHLDNVINYLLTLEQE